MPAGVIEECRSLDWTLRVRPLKLQNFLQRLFRLRAERTIFETVTGLKMYINPFTRLGRALIRTGQYEPDTCRDISALLPPGGVFIDIGANEGFFCCLAAQIGGPTARIVAVEPQSRLQDVIDINLALNGISNCSVIMKALSDDPVVILNLWPTGNSGATSIVRSYRWASDRQVTPTVSFSALLETCNLDQVDVVKIDVEGYEKEVIDSMLAAVSQGRVKNILLDYHASILKDRKIAWNDLDDRLKLAGMERSGDDEAVFSGSGYARYTRIA